MKADLSAKRGKEGKNEYKRRNDIKNKRKRKRC